MRSASCAFALLVAITLGIGSTSVHAGKKDDKKGNPAPAIGGVVFEVYKDKGGDYRFRLQEGDKLLASSGKGYKTVAEVEQVIDTIKKNAAKAPIVRDDKK